MIPLIAQDRGRLDPANVAAIIIAEQDGSKFQLGTKHRIIDGWFTRNQFEPTEENFYSRSDVNFQNIITVRSAARQESVSGHLGMQKCFCTGKCKDKRCNCLKSNVKCNSRCHNQKPCSNRD